MALDEIYIEIDGIKYFTARDNSLTSFSFKINKRGGESGKIIFAKDETGFSPNKKVSLYVKGEKKYTGFIEKISANGKVIHTIPNWGHLQNQYVIGTLNLTGTVSIKELVLSLKSFISATGISFIDERIIIPNEYNIEVSISGKNISSILDDCEKALPEGYVWGVDNNNIFFFSVIESRAQKTIGFDLESFSQSEIETDYSDVYSQCLVKIKDSSTGSDSLRAIGIVGRGAFTFNGLAFFYPKLKVSDFVGEKTRVKEFNIEVDLDNYESVKGVFDMAYNELIYQSIPLSSKVKNINIASYIPKMLETVSIKNTQSEGITKDILGGEDEIVKTPPLYIHGGFISAMGSAVGFSANTENIGMLNFRYNKKWQDFCNHTHNITSIIVRYNSQSNVVVFTIDDGVIRKNIKAYGGYVKIEISEMKKRDIQISLLGHDSMFVYNQVTGYADFGAKTNELLTRIIEFDYKAGILSVNAEYSRINVINTGFLFNQNKRLKDLENLLSSTE